MTRIILQGRCSSSSWLVIVLHQMRGKNWGCDGVWVCLNSRKKVMKLTELTGKAQSPVEVRARRSLLLLWCLFSLNFSLESFQFVLNCHLAPVKQNCPMQIRGAWRGKCCGTSLERYTPLGLFLADVKCMHALGVFVFFSHLNQISSVTGRQRKQFKLRQGFIISWKAAIITAEWSTDMFHCLGRQSLFEIAI